MVRKVRILCDNCGKVFKVTLEEYTRQRSNGILYKTFCSDKCMKESVNNKPNRKGVIINTKLKK